jgi:VWFA-related protein
MTIGRVAFFAVLAAVVVAVSPRAQTPAGQAPFRTGVDVVRLDVSVLDKNRRPVRNLTAADFTVIEEGEPRPIVAFTAIDVSDAPEHPAAWMRDVGSDVASNRLDTRRIVAIVMDDCHTNLADGTIARSVARNVVDRLGPNDLAGIVFTYTGRAQNFTTDHRQLLTAVDSFVPKNSPKPHPFSAEAGNSGPRAGPPLACQLRGGLSATLKGIAVALKDTPEGRKAIVLISPGIPFSFSLEGLEGAEDGDDVVIAYQALQRANVNVYTFDPSGLTQDGINVARLDTLRIFAENTGGFAIAATNAPEEQVPQVFAENGSYYLLGIRAGATDSRDRFRKVSIKVNRPDVVVRARPGYFVERPARAPSPETEAKTATALDKAFGNALPTGDLPLSVSVAPLAMAGRREAVLAVTIGMIRPVSDRVVTETLQLRTTAFEYETYKDRGTSLQAIELTARPNAAGERRFEVPARLTVRPGRYEVRVGAETSGGAVGGVFVAADVPDFEKAKLALSGLILGTPRRAPADPADALADLVPIAPTVRREFSTSEPVLALLRIYQRAMRTAAPAQVTATIVDATNRQVFADLVTLGPDRFSSERSADYRLDLANAKLGAGDYLLTIEASAANNAARRLVRFRVR